MANSLCKVKMLNRSDIIKYDYSGNYHTYKYDGYNRKYDFNQFSLSDCNPQYNNCYYKNNNIIYPATLIEFSLPLELLTFAYNIAVWKAPYVQDNMNKDDYRDYYSKLYNIFSGVISECLSYKFFEYYGFEMLYYEIERSGPVQNNNEEYDLKINGHYMSLKVDSNCVCEFINNSLLYKNSVIKRPWNSKDLSNLKDDCFTQFIVKHTERFDFSEMMKRIIKHIECNEPINLKYCMIGGVVTNSIYYSMDGIGLYWKSKGDKIAYIDMEESFDVKHYLESIQNNIA